MKIRTVFLLPVIAFCSVTLSWGLTWDVTNTMTATLDSDGVLTITTTKDAEAIPDYGWDKWAPWHSDYEDILSIVIGDNVTRIGHMAFYEGVSVTSVTISSSVTSIGEHAFRSCISLTTISIPASVSLIEWKAFEYCEMLEAIQVDAANTAYSSVDGVLFNKDKSSLICYPYKKGTVYEIPSTVIKIEGSAFCNAELTAITIPNTVITIGENAFSNTSLTSVTIPNSVENIGVFSYCSMLTSILVDAGNPNFTSDAGVLYSKDKKLLHAYPAGKKGAFTIPSSVEIVWLEAFAGCKELTSVTIPNSVTEIRERAFEDCSGLISVIMSKSVNYIGGYAFSYCTGLESITIPNTVTTIGYGAFYTCTALKDVKVAWTTPLIVANDVEPFLNVNTIAATLHVPTGTKALYQVANVWNSFGMYDDYDPAGIGSIEAHILKAHASNGILHISGLCTGEMLSIYNLAGQQLYKGIAKAEEENIPFTAHGIYIVNAGEQSVKVIMN